MTIASILGWSIFGFGLVIVGAKGGLLLILSRAIDNARAAISCAELCWHATRYEWRRNWSECLRSARLER